MKWNDPKHTLAVAITMITRLGASYHITHEGKTYTNIKHVRAVKAPRRKLVDRYRDVIFNIPVGETADIKCSDKTDFNAIQRAVTGRLSAIAKVSGPHYTHHTKNADGSYILHITHCLPTE